MQRKPPFFDLFVFKIPDFKVQIIVLQIVLVEILSHGHGLLYLDYVKVAAGFAYAAAHAQLLIDGDLAVLTETDSFHGAAVGAADAALAADALGPVGHGGPA